MADNYKDILNQAVALPLAIEAVLPEGAPKLSTLLNTLTGNLPDAPDFIAPIPDLPALPSTTPPETIERTPITIIWE
jgi:hypothetical protein